jgi:citrate lyase subunit beta/citryl-CoA lyase
MVRLNAVDSPGFEDDLKVASHAGVAGVIIPKAACSRDLARVAAALPRHALLPLVETAAGLAAARALARARGVQRLVFGSIDFQADLGIEHDEETLRPYRAELVLASRLAGLPPPVDGVTLALDDSDAVLRDTLSARRQGFGGKLCIHPRQLAAVRRGFAPSEAELRWARDVLRAAEGAGGAAIALDGRMVDAPVVLRAQALLAQAP